MAIANEISDALCRTNLSPYESRILWCIFRKTYGFNKKDDWISNSQLIEMTGLLKGTFGTESRMTKFFYYAVRPPFLIEIIDRRKPDYRTRGVYYKLGAELLDAFPAKKQINADVGVEQMLDEAENSTDYAEFNTQEEKK